MPPIKHALLGASSAARWIACTPSAQATANLPDEETKYAAEGTRAHEVCESILRTNLACWEQGYGLQDLRSGFGCEYDADPPEMFKAAIQYVGFIHELWVGFPCRPGVFIEQEVDVSRWVPLGFGTCDRRRAAAHHRLQIRPGRPGQPRAQPAAHVLRPRCLRAVP